MRFHSLNCDLGPTAIVEANTQQVFVDILVNDVITPLATFKVVHKITFEEASLFLII